MIPTRETVASLEMHIRRLRPGVDSELLHDAVAYAFDVRQQAGSIPAIYGRRFQDFFASRGDRELSSLLYHAIAASEIACIILQFPELTTRGIGRDLYETEQSRTEDSTFDADQAELFGLQSLKGFIASKAFLQNIPRTKSLRNFSRSYWIKHIAERYTCTYPDGEALGPTYVSNGILIAAAIHLGFRFWTHKGGIGATRRDVVFNMSFRALNQLDLAIRGPNDRWRF